MCLKMRKIGNKERIEGRGNRRLMMEGVFLDCRSMGGWCLVMDFVL